MASSPTKRYTVYFKGRVQGVGFRYNTAAIARRYDVTGYVRNCPDGRVELVAEGTSRELNEFVREVSDHFISNIRDVKKDIGDATSEFTGFDIRH